MDNSHAVQLFLEGGMDAYNHLIPILITKVLFSSMVGMCVFTSLVLVLIAFLVAIWKYDFIEDSEGVAICTILSGFFIIVFICFFFGEFIAYMNPEAKAIQILFNSGS